MLYGRRLAAAVGECGQYHVVSVRRKLNTKLTLATKLTRQCALSGVLGPTRVYHANCISIGSAVIAGYRCSHHTELRVVGRISCCLCLTMRSNNCVARNVKVTLSAKITLHACAVDVTRGKPDVGNFPACRSQGLVTPRYVASPRLTTTDVGLTPRLGILNRQSRAERQSRTKLTVKLQIIWTEHDCRI